MAHCSGSPRFCAATCRSGRSDGVQRHQAPAEGAWLDGPACVARAGPGECAVTTMPGASCLHQVHRPGAIPSAPPMVGAVMSPPDARAVLPLLPAPRVHHDGTATHAGARQAANRCSGTLRHEHPPLTCIITADRVRATAPPARPCTRLGSMLSAASPKAFRPIYSTPVRAPVSPW